MSIHSRDFRHSTTYDAEDRTLDRLSAEHPPSAWFSLDIDPQTRQLWALGKLGSGVVIADPVRGVSVVYYEDASGNAQQLLRLPDASTMGPTAVRLSGAALTRPRCSLAIRTRGQRGCIC
ncbi:hypothetical protein [Armatimonas sp.]|uniref:hypothetical protein n=1 Tax=Armatimonas sp. TaxID=1872638 RepID=UPI00286CC75C|nr:hypothetical protein [Armatimonas sp.]